MTPLPLPVKTFPDNSHVTVTGCHHFCQGGFVFTQYVRVLVGLFVSWIIKKTLNRLPENFVERCGL